VRLPSVDPFDYVPQWARFVLVYGGLGLTFVLWRLRRLP
jgi:hypothetical protein